MEATALIKPVKVKVVPVQVPPKVVHIQPRIHQPIAVDVKAMQNKIDHLTKENAKLTSNNLNLQVKFNVFDVLVLISFQGEPEQNDEFCLPEQGRG